MNYKKYLAFLASFVFLSMPFLLFAQGSSATTIANPLGATNTSVEAVMTKVMNVVVMVGAIVVVFFIIYSGFKFVTAGSSDTDRTKAKEIFYATVIGGAILLGADIIANVMIGTVNSIKQ